MKPYGGTLNLDAEAAESFPISQCCLPTTLPGQTRFLYILWNRVCGKALGLQRYLPQEGINEIVIAMS